VIRCLVAACFALSICANSFADNPPPSSHELQQRLDAIKQRLPQFKQQLDALKSQGQDTSYPLVSYTVLENFSNFIQPDLAMSVPEKWGFVAVNGAKVEYGVDKGNAHGGDYSAKFTSTQKQQPNVYGMLEYSGVIKLTAGKPYTISAWTRSESPGQSSIVGGASWQFRMALKPTENKWQRMQFTFTPEERDCAFQPRVIVESETPGVWVDDVALVEGKEAETGTNLLESAGGFEGGWTQRRADRELTEMERIVTRLDAELKDATSGKKLPEVPRWTGQERPKIDGPSFIGPVKFPHSSEIVQRPIFFIGYGHFAQVRKDVEKFPAYGINIEQCGEWGPSSIYPKEGETDDKMLNQTLDTLDRCQKAGVALDLLISPHYFPDWMIEKYKLRIGRADFFGYSIYRPEGQELLKKFIAHIMPKLKDHPALFSICLSNEPINVEPPTDASRKAWHEWLTKRYETVEKLNKKWKSSYKSIDEIPQPTEMGKSPSPLWYDFCRWNDEWFAGFHKMLADAVHAVAPNIPVHAKGTTWHHYRASEVQTGLEPTLFGSFSDINGNDSVNLYRFDNAKDDAPERGGVDFPEGWMENAIGYELLRAGKEAPVFNSENHPVFDGDMRPIPAEHFRATMWQGAIHGMGATTTWVWEREKDNPRSALAGNVMERPACAEAMGIVCHDLNRVAPEITAIQKAPPDVCILFSPTSLVWDRQKPDLTLIRTFVALSFTGLKTSFITERHLEVGQLRDTPMIVVPDVTHISAAAFETLKKYKGKVLFIGNDATLSRDEYDDALTGKIDGEHVAFDPLKDKWQTLYEALLPKLAKPKIAVVDESGKPFWGVQWLSAETPQGTVVNLYNCSHDTKTFRIAPSTKSVDLLTGEPIAADQSITMKSMEVKLVRISK
jgi:hypothetical protein